MTAASTSRPQLWFLVGVTAVLVLVPVFALAVTSPGTLQSGTVFNATAGPQVELGEDASINVSRPFPANDTVSLGATNTSGGEVNVTIAGVEAADAVTSAAIGNLSGASPVALARTDTNISVAATTGNVSLVDLVGGATLGDGNTDIGARIGTGGGTVEVRGLGGIDAVTAINTTTGAVVKRAAVSSGAASLSFGLSTVQSLALRASAPTFDNGVAVPDNVTRAPGQTVTVDIPVDHAAFPSETVDVALYRVSGGTVSPSSDPQFGAATLSSAGSATASWTLPAVQTPAVEWYAVATDSAGRTTFSDVFFVELDDDAVGDPILVDGSATDGVLTQSATIDLSIAVEHENGTGESVDVEFYEFGTGDPTQDTELANVTVTTDATATATGVSVGDGFDWYAVARGVGGQTDTSAVFSVRTPGTLEVRDAADGALVDDRTVRFNVTGPGFAETVNSTDGTLDYSQTQATAGDTLLINVCAQGYYRTTTQVPALGTNDSIFLQRGPGHTDNPASVPAPCNNVADPSNDTDSVTVRFELIDNTQGNFPAENTTLRISDGNGNLTHSEPFGSLNRVDVVLEQGERYQLDVDGPSDTRSLGGFTATQSETVQLTIGGRDFGLPPAGAYEVSAQLTEQQAVNFIEFRYADPDTNTSELSVEIYERQNESNVIFAKNFSGPLGNVSARVAISDNQTAKQWLVNYSGVRNTSVISGEIPVGGETEVPLPGGTILTAMVLIGLTVLAALYSGPIASLGSIILVVVSGGAILVGWLPISPLIWFAALVVAVGGWARVANGPT